MAVDNRAAHAAFDAAQEQAQAEVDAAGGVVGGEQTRVLICFECKTQEQIPDYPPTDNPNNDVTLHYVDEKHGGQTDRPHYRTVLRIPLVAWEDMPARRQILAQAWKEEKGLSPSYYDLKDTLKEDAVNCHKLHNRQVPCLDWHDHSKKLRPPTRKDRKQAARELELAGQRNNLDLDRLASGGPTIFLCDFCPVAVAVDYAKRKELGQV